ncbi:MAG: ATP-dependent Clp protease ATP-binding subunit [Mycoplasmatales bacterium]
MELKNLNKFAINLTEQARNNKIDPIIGREEEIKNVIRILARKTKNNPILLGEPGVGKTAIVEGLALKIIQNNIPKQLKDKEVYALDLGALVAGAKFQGEFEERLKGLMEEVKQNNDKVILFIDEIHMIIGIGKTSGAMDGANLLKPMLARGELNCIGATTLGEFKENIEKDAAFERRFQRVLVKEPSITEAVNILRGIKENLEVYHGIQIEDEAILTAVKASDRYISERFLPDKAIDLIDEAAANINVKLGSEPEELAKLTTKITSLEIEKKALKGTKKNKERYEQVKEELTKIKVLEKELKDKWEVQKSQINQEQELKRELQSKANDLIIAKQNLEYEKAATLEYSTIPKLKEKLQNFTKDNQEKLVNDILTPADIYLVISRLTNIPVQNLKADTKEKLLHLESNLTKKVLGQNKATQEIANAVIRNQVNISDPNKPIGTFLFLGPTGVGKTEIAKALSYELFDSLKNMFRIDMSEYMEKHAVSRLIGSPPGYIGFESGGTLTEYVRTNPYSVILFDEIEKAHPDVLNILLQILDEGHITDAKGKTINFKNTIIVMTSNIGSDLILQNPMITLEQLEDKLMGHLKPELINRIDTIIKFNPINKTMYKEITKKLLKELQVRLQDNEISLTYDKELLDYIYEVSYKEQFGARPIKRFIQSQIENQIALFILKNPKQALRIMIENDKIQIN